MSRPLFEERFVCIMRREHPTARRPLGLDTFLSLSHLLVSPENDGFGRVDAALARRGPKRRLALTLAHMYAAPMLVARSDLIATVMEGVVRESGRPNDLCVIAPPIELETTQFVLFWHGRNDVHPAQRWLRDCIGALSSPASANPAPGG